MRICSTAAVFALVLAACGPPPRPPGPPPEYPGTLVEAGAIRSPAVLGDAFALEQRVQTIYPEGEQSFRAVLQRRGASVVLVGFGPHGGRGFTLQQEGGEVSFDSQLPGELPFPPEFMLHDVQRVWFRGLPGPMPDGEHEAQLDGETVTERWEGGRLMTRRFVRPGREGVISVDYGTGLGGDVPPETVRMDNGWFGYELVLTTLSHHRLEAPPADDSPQEEPSPAEETSTEVESAESGDALD
ncbi:MAG: DUF3261 domain-containing protein [Sandaracinaceae bacterium]